MISVKMAFAHFKFGFRQKDYSGIRRIVRRTDLNQAVLKDNEAARHSGLIKCFVQCGKI